MKTKILDTVVSDTSPLISFILIKKIHFIESLIENFYIPNAVFNELFEFISNKNYYKIYKNELSWLEKKQVKKVDVMNYEYKKFNEIDKGEIEAIILAKKINADFLLIDDKKAREIAENYFEINCIGTLGLLVIAKEKGLIDELRPVFIELLRYRRFFSKKIINTILLQNGEIPL